MSDRTPSYEELKARLDEAEAILESLRHGEVDVVMGPQEPLLVQFKSLVEERDRLSRLVTSMAEMAPTLIVVTDHKGQIVRFNRACRDLTGYSKEEVMGKTVAEVFGPGGPVPFCDPSVQNFEGPITRVWTTGEGEKRRIEWRCAAIASPDGDGHFVIGIGLDVTERTLAEEELKKTKRDLSLIFDSVPALIWQKDKDGRYEQVNQAYCNATGLEKEAIIGRTDHDLFPRDIAEAYVSDDQEILRAKKARGGVEERHLKSSGEYGWSLTHKMPSFDGDGNITGTIGFALDITERKRYLDELRLTNSFLDSIIENMPSIVFLKDAKDLRFVRFNRAGERLLGYSRSELIGKSDYDLFPRDQADFFTKKDREVLEGKKMVDIGDELVATRDKGVRLVHTMKVPILDERDEPEYLLGIAYDVTELRGLEAQRTQLHKAEGLNRMAGAIAHHFNNHLQAVMGYLQLGMDDLPPDGPASEALIQSMKAAQRAAGVGRQMLTYLGQAAGRRETMDLSEICKRALADLQRDFPENVVLEVDLASPGPPVHVNRNQMGQVVGNLIANAQEAMADSGGTIHVGIRTVSLEDIPLSHRFPVDWEPQDGAYACLEVRDTGPGILEQDVKRIFDPFFSTKFTGRGLGLSVVLGTVHAHGGGIAVESRCRTRSAEGGTGKVLNAESGTRNAEEREQTIALRQGPAGSVFRVYLPLSAESVPQREKDAISAVSGGGTVLLVEDAADVRRLGRLMLQKLGLEVLIAEDGAEGVRVFREHRDEIRLVLCDLTMPRMDGWEVLAAIREMRPDIPVILASGYDEASVMAGNHPEWPQAFLAKPYGLDDLRETISRMIGP
jgi:two-component system, cell cycle sensor histidine kinase and response regulator CckA